MTHDQHDDDQGTKPDTFTSGLALRMQWNEGDFQSLPASTLTPEYIRENLDAFPLHFREYMIKMAEALERDSQRDGCVLIAAPVIDQPPCI